MLLTISTTHAPATDLGFLLHKNPDRVHRVELSFGGAWVVYPAADGQRCTVALLVEVDPVGLVRDRKGPKGRDLSLAQYVNDRLYAASSFLSVAIGTGSRPTPEKGNAGRAIRRDGTTQGALRRRFRGDVRLRHHARGPFERRMR